MSFTLPSPRRIAGALAVLHALPPPALAALAERLIDRLDTLDDDPDLEPDEAEAEPDCEGLAVVARVRCCAVLAGPTLRTLRGHKPQHRGGQA